MPLEQTGSSSLPPSEQHTRELGRQAIVEMRRLGLAPLPGMLMGSDARGCADYVRFTRHLKSGQIEGLWWVGDDAARFGTWDKIPYSTSRLVLTDELTAVGLLPLVRTARGCNTIHTTHDDDPAAGDGYERWYCVQGRDYFSQAHTEAGALVEALRLTR